MQTGSRAWKGKDPVACYLAICELPRLPTPLMGEGVLALDETIPSENPPLRDAARFALASVLGRPKTGAPQARDHFESEFEAHELKAWWAMELGVPFDPEGDPSALRDVVALLAGPGSVPGSRSCAAWLLREWTGTGAGFDPSLHYADHLEGVARNWRRWIEERGDRLKWDPDSKRFR